MQEKSRVKEALEDEQRRVHELENHLTHQKEVGSSGRQPAAALTRPRVMEVRSEAQMTVGGVGCGSPRVIRPQEGSAALGRGLGDSRREL